MKARNLLLSVAGLFLVAGVWAAEDNPYKKAKVGDWVKHKTATQTMGTNMSVLMTQKVTAKDDKGITIETVMEANGKKMAPQSATFTWDQLEKKKGNAWQAPGAKIEKIKEGDETITVGGKSYKCHWVESKVTVEKPVQSSGMVKVWTCPDVPINGMVKMVSDTTMNMAGQKMQTKATMELVGSSK